MLITISTTNSVIDIDDQIRLTFRCQNLNEHCIPVKCRLCKNNNAFNLMCIPMYITMHSFRKMSSIDINIFLMSSDSQQKIVSVGIPQPSLNIQPLNPILLVDCLRVHRHIDSTLNYVTT